MKKIVFLILILTCWFNLTSCSNIEMPVFEEFINSKDLSVEATLTLQNYDRIGDFKFFDLLKNEESMHFTDYIFNYELFLDNEDKIAYYNLTKGIKRKSTNLNNGDLNFDIHISNYYSDYIIGPNMIYYKIDIYNYLNDINSKLVENYNSDTVLPLQACAFMENNKVVKIEIDVSQFSSILSKYSKMNGVYNSKITLKIINYNRVDIPYFSKGSFTNIPSTDFLDGILLHYDPNNYIAIGGRYILDLKENYKIPEGSTLELSGSFRDKMNNEKIIPLNNLDFTVEYYPALDTNKIGITNYNITINLAMGESFTASIQVNVLDVLNSTETVDLQKNDIVSVFDQSGFLLMVSPTKVYKYDYVSKSIIGEVDIKCEANSIYFKDGYLYVAANFLTSTGYKGTISKIDFDNFEIEKQVEVKCYPYSIIVDKRDNVIISKVSGSSFYYSIVDMETGELTNLVNFTGNSGDYLIYDEITDVIHVITPFVTDINFRIKYFYGEYVSYTYYEDYKSRGTLSKVDYITGNGEFMIYTNYFQIGYCYYDFEINDFKTVFIQDFFDYSNVKNFPITYDSNTKKIYGIGMDVNKLYCLNSYDTINSQLQSSNIRIDGEINYIFVYDEQIYINYKNDSKLYIYDLE